MDVEINADSVLPEVCCKDIHIFTQEAIQKFTNSKNVKIYKRLTKICNLQITQFVSSWGN